MTEDALDGYRNVGPQGVEAELRTRLGEHDFLVDLFQLGEQMQAFVETTVGDFLYTELKQQFNASLNQLLEPPEGPQATERLVADLRATWSALGKIEHALRAGHEAGRLIVDMDQPSR